MLTFITVHGTGDGPRAEHGAEPQWWCAESPFCTELLAAAPTGSRVEPFVWSGANDEGQRRAAAERLLKRLRTADVQGERIHLIGHSHGGSVIAIALRYAAADKRPLPNLVAITSIGTPFLQLRHKLFPWDRFGPVGQAAATFGVIAAIIGVTQAALMGLAQFNPNIDAGWFGEIIITACAVVVGMSTLLLVRLGRQRRGQHGRRASSRFQMIFAPRWLAIASNDDEAIGGLSRLTGLRARLFHRTVLNAAAGLLAQVFFLGFIATWWALFLFGSQLPAALAESPENTPFDRYTFVGGPSIILYQLFGPVLYPFLWLHAVWIEGVRHLFFDAVLTGGDYGYGGAPVAHLFSALFGLTLIGGYFVGLIVFITAVQWITERTIGAWTAAALNASARNAALTAGYGAEGVRENPAGVGAAPFDDVERLPDEIDDRVLAFAEQNIATTYRGLHKTLFDTDHKADENLTLAEAALKHVTWSELVHTGYFRVPECRAHLIARIIARS